MKRPVAFSGFLVLLLIGNLFGAYKLFTSGQEFLDKFPLLTPKALNLLRIIPCLNVIALAGVWSWQRWGAVTAIGLGVFTIGFDVAFGIWYHLIVAAPALLILCLGVALYRNRFHKDPLESGQGN